MKETDQEAIGAMARLRKAMAEAGLVLISIEALQAIRAVEDEVPCPYCSEWNHITAIPDEEVEVTCIGCGGVFNSNLVRYLTAEAI